MKKILSIIAILISFSCTSQVVAKMHLGLMTGVEKGPPAGAGGNLGYYFNANGIHSNIMWDAKGDNAYFGLQYSRMVHPAIEVYAGPVAINTSTTGFKEWSGSFMLGVEFKTSMVTMVGIDYYHKSMFKTGPESIPPSIYLKFGFKLSDYEH